jgi:hypothetical protein
MKRFLPRLVLALALGFSPPVFAQGTAGNGTPITGATMPAGGSGQLGWLSAIWSKLSGTLSISGTVNADTQVTGLSLSATSTANAIPVALQNSRGTVGWTVTGLTASGATLVAEGANDGGASGLWSAINSTAPGGGVLSPTVTADGNFRVNAGGHSTVRLRVSTVGTGTITVSYDASSATSVVALSAPLPPGANAIGSVGLLSGSYTNGSQVVPTVATTVLAAPSNGARVRIVAIDTAIAAGTSSTVSTWCAWGTASANPAVSGSNGFPLNSGFDDAGAGTNQLALNCIQAAGAGHYSRLEAY